MADSRRDFVDSENLPVERWLGGLFGLHSRPAEPSTASCPPHRPLVVCQSLAEVPLTGLSSDLSPSPHSFLIYLIL